MLLNANEVHRDGMRVKMKHDRTAFVKADDNDNVSVYVGCKVCGRMDNGKEMPIEEVSDYIKNLPCCH